MLIGADNVRSLTIDEIMVESDHSDGDSCHWSTTYIARKTHPRGLKLFGICTQLPISDRPFMLSLIPDFYKPFISKSDAVEKIRSYALTLKPSPTKVLFIHFCLLIFIIMILWN
jgi:hypothetical protein